MFIEIFLALGVLWFIYKQWCLTYNYWEEKGFPQLKGKFPFGSTLNNIFLNQYLGTFYQEIYKTLDPHPLGGYYRGRRCLLVLRDPELIKRVLAKDFSHFRDRLEFAATGTFSKNLFFQGGDTWRALRVKLTPTFTSGKLKGMFALFQECATKLDEHLKVMVDKGEEIEIKDWMARFTTDIITSCAFGLEAKTIDTPDNVFRYIGQTIFPPSATLFVKIIRFFMDLVPTLSSKIKVNTTSKKLENSMTKIVEDTINYREKNNISRNDFLDLLIKMMKEDRLVVDQGDNKQREITLKMDLPLLIGQCFVFFAAGYETSSSVLTMCFYELALNPHIQDKLRAEIDDVLKRNNDQITYQVLQDMPYLEQVVLETIRKYPTLPFLSRVCTKPYQIPESNLIIDKDIRVIIPVYGLHHDPKYFPDPEKYNPERFSPGNKELIVPYTFLPFGEGPRNCIGMRFGMLQTKIGIVTIISKYKLMKCSNTPEKLTFLPTPLVTGTEEKLILKIDLRD